MFPPIICKLCSIKHQKRHLVYWLLKHISFYSFYLLRLSPQAEHLSTISGGSIASSLPVLRRCLGGKPEPKLQSNNSEISGQTCFPLISSTQKIQKHYTSLHEHILHAMSQYDTRCIVLIFLKPFRHFTDFDLKHHSFRVSENPFVSV